MKAIQNVGKRRVAKLNFVEISFKGKCSNVCGIRSLRVLEVMAVTGSCQFKHREINYLKNIKVNWLPSGNLEMWGLSCLWDVACQVFVRLSWPSLQLRACTTQLWGQRAAMGLALGAGGAEMALLGGNWASKGIPNLNLIGIRFWTAETWFQQFDSAVTGTSLR